MKTCTYHCSACGSHFTSLEAFDAHRSGPYDGERHCDFPDDKDGKPQLVDRAGVCNLSGPRRVVTLYEHRRAARVRAHYAAERAGDSPDRAQAG